MLEINKTILKEIQHPLYIERIERWVMPELSPNDAPIQMHSGYSLDGHYIGDIATTRHLCEKYGIKPELKSPDSKVCSIGFSEKHNKWFGWSHRAISGFTIGNKLFEEKFGDDNTPYIEHGNKTIENIDEAKLAARRFAESVASDKRIATQWLKN